MKRLAFIIAGILILALIIATGCSPDLGPPPGEEASTCVKCHSDKELLKETATEEEEKTSGETTGEG